MSAPSSPINRLIDASSLKCTICGAARGKCDCWESCECGWTKRRGEDCGNTAHTIKRKSAEYANSLATTVDIGMRGIYPEAMKHASGGFRKTLRAHIEGAARKMLEAWEEEATAKESAP